ncbi:LysR family transcriptional regulator [Janthinobacterium sp. 13]|uniref:LysR family transcriptional regulator n=1 Tax=Janthinobacterium sp. 13 TaxID=2035211 RepID=UPI000C16945B|nr:LysR family transcriptional regulator [Janthinobacterium sp. 13]PIF09226.1 DNA-binding transcriptional LysR family regulator [Janthinobacterium sp. 13]
MHNDDRFDGINDFVMTVKLGSFAAAAAAQGVTASGVGKSVSRLEARLGTKLLHRTTRRLTLTPEGRTYYDMCVQMLEDLEATEHGLIVGQQVPTGRLRVDVPAAFGRRHILPTLLALAEQHTGIELAVTFTDRTVNLVEEGIDLAVRIGALNNDADLVARQLGTQRLLICATPSYLARHGTPQVRDDLARHDCIVGWRRQGPAVWLLREADGSSTEQAIRVRHALRDGEAMLAATLAGAGLCQLPTWLIDAHLASGQLVPVLQQHAGGEMPIHAVWPATRYVKPRLRAAIDALVALAAAPNPVFHPAA